MWSCSLELLLSQSVDRVDVSILVLYPRCPWGWILADRCHYLTAGALTLPALDRHIEKMRNPSLPPLPNLPGSYYTARQSSPNSFPHFLHLLTETWRELEEDMSVRSPCCQGVTTSSDTAIAVTHMHALSLSLSLSLSLTYMISLLIIWESHQEWVSC